MQQNPMMPQQMSHEQMALQKRMELAKQGYLMDSEGNPLETLVKVDTPQGEASFVVNPKDCVEKTHLHDNIAANIKLIDRFVDSYSTVNKEKAIIASAGPSLKRHLDFIKEEQEKGTRIFCVKHSLPTLVKAGIDPDGCIILDPRDINGESTHNIVRKTLFSKFNKDKTVFFIASMTDPSVTRYLQSKGAKIAGWHAAVANIHQFFQYFVKFAVAGGSCSAIRGISLLSFLGFKDIHLIGFDCSFEERPKDITKMLEGGRPKYLHTVVNGIKFISTGELLALAQDLERFFADKRNEINISMSEGGLVYEIFKLKYKPLPKYDELIDEVVKQNSS